MRHLISPTESNDCFINFISISSNDNVNYHHLHQHNEHKHNLHHDNL